MSLRDFKTKELQYEVFNGRKKEEGEKQTVLVADAVCGAGKTQAAIEYINTAPRWCKFLYVTPFLTEVKRIKESCPEANFYEPTLAGGSKTKNFQKLFDEGKNIVCTHALFQTFNKDNFDSIRANHYILILDEVCDVVEKYVCNSGDLYLLFNPENNYVSINPETKQIIWNMDDNIFYKQSEKEKLLQYWGSEGREFIEKIKSGCMYLYNFSETEIKNFYKANRPMEEFKINILMWAFPVSIFNAFEKVFIITYMFEGQYQANYYKYFNVPFKYLHTEALNERDKKTGLPRYQFEDAVYDKPQIANYSKYKDLIEIYDGKINSIGNYIEKTKTTVKSALSKKWYLDSMKTDNDNLEQLKRNVYNYFYNVCKQKNASDLIWTTFKDYQDLLKRPPFSKKECFVSCNSRATNEYRNRHYCGYLVNRFADPAVKNFFSQRGIVMNEDIYALSELIQWLFRSAIRANEKIYVYVPSQRMRELLQTWVEGNFIYW